MLGFEMADDRLDGGPSAQLAFDLGCHAPFLAGDEDPELVIGSRVVAAVSLVGEDTLEGVADHCLHVRDHGCQGVTIIGIARQRLHMGDELPAKPKLGGTRTWQGFIDLMLPISFKPLLKYLCRYSLVNYGKLLERKRGGYTHNIGINGL